MYKYTIPRFLPAITPFITWRVKTESPVVYVTFDDGPHPVVTPWVLEQLEKYGAKATFFCVGDNVKKHPEVFNEILKGDHSAGNHTFNHINGWKSGNKEYFDNVERCAALVKSNLFRPPFGRIGLRQAMHLQKRYRIVLWDILSRDYDYKLNIDESLSTMKNKTGKGSVIVFHDSEKAFDNLRLLLPEMLRFLNDSGYQMLGL